MNLLDTLAAAIGPRRLPLRVLASLFDSGAAAIRIGEIPQTLDQVIVGTADRIRPTGIRSAYVIGASAGVFPAAGGLQHQHLVCQTVDEVPVVGHNE